MTHRHCVICRKEIPSTEEICKACTPIATEIIKKEEIRKAEFEAKMAEYKYQGEETQKQFVDDISKTMKETIKEDTALIDEIINALTLSDIKSPVPHQKVNNE
jgi:predicted nucleic acid-binding Zn ribbon protein